MTVTFTSWYSTLENICSHQVVFEHWLCENQYKVQTVALGYSKTIKAQGSFKRAHSLMGEEKVKDTTCMG